MKKAWTDLKSFITVVLTIALVIVVLFSLFTNRALEEKSLLLFTNIITSVFTYYFTKSDSNEKSNKSEDV